MASSLAIALLLPYSELSDAALGALLAPQLPGSFLITEDLLSLILSHSLLPLLLSSPAAWRACAAALAPYQGLTIDPQALVELRHCIPPHALAQLVADGRHAAAATYACHYLRLHPALATLDGGMALLEPCLVGHARAATAADAALLSVTGCLLPRTAERLFKSVGTVSGAALEALRVAGAPRQAQK